MPGDDITIRTRLLGARTAAAEAKTLGTSIGHVDSASRRTERSGRRLGRGFLVARKGIGPLRAGVTGLAGALGFTGAIGLAGAFKVSYTEAREAQKVNRATGAVLKSTGGKANIGAKGIQSLSTRLSNLAAVDDETIQKGENLLLTFRDIRNAQGKGNAIFNRTTKAAVNMSAAFEAAGKSMSISDATLQLGKAINDPATGMSRLTRIGVTFTQKQQDQVKALEASNHHFAAQKIILGELNKEFGGMAKSQADPMKRVGVVFHNLAETLGKLMLPAIDKFGKKLANLGVDLQKIWGGSGSVGDKMHKTLLRIFGPDITSKIESVAKSIKNIAVAAWPVVKAFGRITGKVLAFLGTHPDLVKFIAVVYLARKAFMKLGGGVVLSAIGALIDKIYNIRKAAKAAKVGETIASGISTPAAKREAQTGSQILAKKAGGAFKSAGLVAFGAAALALGGHFMSKLTDKITHLLPGLSGDIANALGQAALPPILGGPSQALIGSGKFGSLGGVKPPRQGVVLHPGRSGTGGSAGHHGPSSKALTGAPLGAATAGGGHMALPDIHVELDGKELTRSVATWTRADRNRR